MTTTDDIRSRLTAACDLMEARNVPIRGYSVSIFDGVEADVAGIPCASTDGVTIIGALVVAECIQPDSWILMNALGVDEGWVLWFAFDYEDAVPPPEYLDAYNLGREFRGRYVR